MVTPPNVIIPGALIGNLVVADDARGD